MVFSVTLSGGLPWGFRLQGGREFNEPIRIAKINPNSKAYNEGIQVGDYVESINGQKTKGLEHQSAQQLIKAATDQLILELTRVGSKPNGTMNGDIHNHIDHELEILNSGDNRPTKSYKPVSFSRQQLSPSSQYNTFQTTPMTVTVNPKKVKSRTAPASPVFQRQFRTAPTSPVMFQSVLKIPPLSPRSTHKDFDTDDLDLHRGQQQTFGGLSAVDKNVSAEDQAWSLPIKIESHKNQAYNSPQSRSYNLDSPRSYESPRSQPQNIFPPPRNFASGHNDLPREIPVVLQAMNEGLRSLRQVPVEVDKGSNNDLARSVNIERSPIQRALLRDQFASTDIDGNQHQHSFGQISDPSRREIPIQIKRGPITSQTSVESHSKPESPRQIHIERDSKKADLEKRRRELERDIDNVIYDAIKQVPIYDKHTKEEIKPTAFGKYPDIDPPPYGAQQSEYIVPTKVESKREKRVEEAIQHQVETDKKDTLQKKWEDMQKDESSRSYATLPVKKKAQGDYPTRHTFESEAGSYSTLPSFGHKVRRSGSPKLQRKIIYEDDTCFSDIEGGRGKAQPSWRPMHSPLQSRHVWKPNVQHTEAPKQNWAPNIQHTEAPKPNWAPNVHHTEAPTPNWAPAVSPAQQRRDVGMSRAPMSRSLSESHGQTYSRDHDQMDLRTQQGRGFIPIQIQHEQKTRKGIMHGLA